MAKKNVLPTATIEDAGIKVSVSKEEWITFRKTGWRWTDRAKFSGALATPALRLLIEWAVDWKIKDESGAFVPFEKKELLDKLDEMEAGNLDVDMPSVPQQTYNKMVIAVYVAMNEASNLPLAQG